MKKKYGFFTCLASPHSLTRPRDSVCMRMYRCVSSCTCVRVRFYTCIHAACVGNEKKYDYLSGWREGMCFYLDVVSDIVLSVLLVLS